MFSVKMIDEDVEFIASEDSLMYRFGTFLDVGMLRMPQLKYINILKPNGDTILIRRVEQ